MPYSVAQVIQAEAATPAGQFAVASTIYNRMQAGTFGGTDAISVANAPGQFAGHLTGSGGPGVVPSTTSSYAQQLGAALESGQPPPGGDPGNALYFQSNQGQPSSVVGGSSVNIGGNYFSDRMGQPSANFVAPSYTGGAGGIANGPADASSGVAGGSSATSGTTGYSVTQNPTGTSTTTSGTAQGTPIQTGLQPEETSFITSTVTGIENAFGGAFKSALTAAETAAGTWLGSVQNWFTRAGLILLGIVLVALALIVVMWDHGGKETVVNISKAAAV
jgi:Cell Wall Hydrolase